jgi:hypothetical protein
LDSFAFCADDTSSSSRHCFEEAWRNSALNCCSIFMDCSIMLWMFFFSFASFEQKAARTGPRPKRGFRWIYVSTDIVKCLLYCECIVSYYMTCMSACWKAVLRSLLAAVNVCCMTSHPQLSCWRFSTTYLLLLRFHYLFSEIWVFEL